MHRQAGIATVSKEPGSIPPLVPAPHLLPMPHPPVLLLKANDGRWHAASCDVSVTTESLWAETFQVSPALAFVLLRVVAVVWVVEAAAVEASSLVVAFS
jgi:hypothetical protein